jgi:hypothetical protein
MWQAVKGKFMSQELNTNPMRVQKASVRGYVRKDFPMAVGDLLIIRNGSGKVVERHEVVNGPYSTDDKGKSVYAADVYIFNR